MCYNNISKLLILNSDLIEDSFNLLGLEGDLTEAKIDNLDKNITILIK
jgi:hypothetical protein